MLFFQRTEFVRRNASRISRVFRLTTAEFKVVVLLCFFLTFGIVNAIYFSLYSRNYNFVLSLALEYFSCELNGNASCENKMESCEVHRDEIQRYRYYGLANTSYFLMGLLTISNFLFAIHVKQLKGQVRIFSMKAASKFRSTLNHSRGAANHSKQSKDSDQFITRFSVSMCVQHFLLSLCLLYISVYLCSIAKCS